MPALEVDHVSAAYGPYRALFDVSFTVPDSGIVALLGSNGAGKSTVARVISGLLASTSGRIILGEQDITGFPAHKIAAAGMHHVPEGRAIFGTLTVEENLILSLRQHSHSKAEALAALERAFVAFPVLKERRKQRGGTLSGGQQRILSLAKVLVLPPKLLVADELSLGLAPVIVDAVYEGLKSISEAGTAILVVEQQVDRALEIATTAVVLEHGSVAFEGPTTEAHDAVERILAARASEDELPDLTPHRGPSKEEFFDAHAAEVWGLLASLIGDAAADESLASVFVTAGWPASRESLGRIAAQIARERGVTGVDEAVSRFLDG